MQRYPQVKVGVSVLLTSGQYLLLAQRQGSHGAGTWDTPGGHLDPGERVIACALRETQEETGLKLDPDCVIDLGYTEDFFEQEGKHYISCVVTCEIVGSACKPAVLEKHKFSTEWLWFDINNLPEPLFTPVANAVRKFVKRG